MTQEPQTDLVVISFHDLIDHSINFESVLERAFGSGGLGVIAIKGIPNWENLINETVPLSHELVSLPEPVLRFLEHPESMYNSGWSYGKEKLGAKADTKKASFYFNPLSDDPRPETRADHPWALPANRWPSKELPDLEQRCKKLGAVMHSVIVALARRIDDLGYGSQIANEMENSLKVKGRMLYYYPLTESDLSEASAKPDGWIGWHNDSGFLTGLTPDLYFEHDSGQIIPNPEPETAGIWVAARCGRLVRVSIPRDCMAIQCGECLQIITGGRLVATPHCVRPPVKRTGIARASMPVFVDSRPEFILNSPNGRDAVFENTVQQWVPPLADRWIEGQTFSDFLGSTFRAYYDWNSNV